MRVIDMKCKSCGHIETDMYFIQLPPAEIQHCPKCLEPMFQLFNSMNVNIKTSDLRWDMWQPSFNKYCNSKREVMNELKKLKDTTGVEYQWEPDNKDMDKLETTRRSEGATVVDQEYKKQVEAKQEEKAMQSYEEGFKQVLEHLT